MPDRELDEVTYRHFVESLGEEYFFYRHGTDGVFSYVSPSVADVLGYAADEFLTHYASFFTDDPINREAAQHTELSMQGVKQPVYALEIRHKDGSRRRLEVLEVPVLDAEGGVRCIEGIAHDVTEGVQREAELREVLDKLAELNREKSQFLALVAHDLKSPLTTIQGWAELILAQLGSGRQPSEQQLERARDGLARILRRTADMATLIDRLLEVNALEEGRLNLALLPVDALAVVRAAVEDQAPAAAAKRIELRLEAPETLPAVTADHDALREVLDNLVSNAIKYSSPGGRVRVTLAEAAEDVRCAVHDDGPGIGAEEQPLLFQKFARLRARPTAGERSVGLGLFIVKALVELMGGRVRYQGGPGQGSAFVVELRRAPKP